MEKENADRNVCLYRKKNHRRRDLFHLLLLFVYSHRIVTIRSISDLLFIMENLSIHDGLPLNSSYVDRSNDSVFELNEWRKTVFGSFSEQRFRQLSEKFKEIYPNVQLKYLCRAPGRVNLIGKRKYFEKKTIMLLVIQANISIIVAIPFYQWPLIKILFHFLHRSMMMNKFIWRTPIRIIRKRKTSLFDKTNEFSFLSSVSFDINDFKISYEKASWFEYFKCGIQGIRDKFPQTKLKGETKVFLRSEKLESIRSFRIESLDRWKYSSKCWSFIVISFSRLCCINNIDREWNFNKQSFSSFSFRFITNFSLLSFFS